MLPAEAKGRVKALALARGAAACGIAAASDLEEFSRYLEATQLLPAGLAYLARDPQKRKNIRAWYLDAASVLVCAFPYWGPGRDYAAELSAAGEPGAYLGSTGRKAFQPDLAAAPGAKISRYVLGPDYHVWVKEKLASMLTAIKEEIPGAAGKLFCDTSPVMEKELGRLAGLGFRGRNTLLLSESLGSWFFLGGIALNFGLPPDAPAGGGCGGCDLCEKACPTGALAGGRLDAARCLSYWTTQAKETMPGELAAKSGGRAYGCDACQECCPLNLGRGN